MKNQQPSDARIAFFGTAPLATTVLDELEKAGFVPALVVASPNMKTRKGFESPPEKKWAEAREIAVVQPEKISEEFLATLTAETWDVFIVASYGKILPQKLLDIPKRGTLNVHPSLLPRFRGASPMRSAILANERDTGVTIIQMDDKMDHGPVVAQKKVAIEPWPARARQVEARLAREGGALLATILPAWLEGTIEARAQNHDLATYSIKMTKEDGLIDLDADGYQNLLKIYAYEGWPGTYTVIEHADRKIRLQILDGRVDKRGRLTPTRVKPEGKKEMSYDDFLRGLRA